MRRSSLLDLFPLFFFQAYLLGTVLLFAFGPWQWKIIDPVPLYTFLIAAQFAILTGYTGAYITIRNSAECKITIDFGLRWFYISLFLNLILFIPTSIARTGNWWPDIIAGVTNPGLAYIENVALRSNGGPAVFVEYIRIIFGFLLVSLFPLTLTYWRRLGPAVRWTSILLICFNMALFVAAGQNKGLADFLATQGFLIILAAGAISAPLRPAFVKAACTLALGAIAFFAFFGSTQLTRLGGAVAGQIGSFVWTPPQSNSSPAPSVEPKIADSKEPEAPPPAHLGATTSAELKVTTEPAPAPATPTSEARATNTPQPSQVSHTIVWAYPDHLIARVAPDFVRNVYESFARYLGQGYQALALAMRLEHSSTFGVGNSLFFARNADRLLRIDYFARESLPGVLERQTGWPALALWHSIYVWIASDVGIVGTIPVMCALGFLLGLSWMNALRSLDPIWITLVYLLLISFFYIPANNQIMQSGETALAFVVLLSIIGLRALHRRIRIIHSDPSLGTPV